MKPQILTELVRRAGPLPPLTWCGLLGSLLGLSVPILSTLVGSLVNVLVHAHHVDELAAARFSTWLPDPSRWLPDTLSPLGQVCWLLGGALALTFGTSLLMSVFYRQLQRASVAFEVKLIEQLRDQGQRLARQRTLSAQNQVLTDSLDYHLPRVRSILVRWWRASPRHFVQLAACILVALLVQPLLAGLTLIATGLVYLIYRFVDRLKRTSQPVVRERAAQHRAAVVNLTIRGPLLASVHPKAELEHRFDDQLTHYARDAVRSLNSSAWKTPLVVFVAGVLGSLFLFVMAVQILRDDSSFSVAGGLTFGLCFTGAATSAGRLQRVARDLKSVQTAAEELDRFLSLRVEEENGNELKKIERIESQAELDHITVLDSQGRKLLDNVSLTLRPGQMIGVLSSQPIQANALVELMLGLGRPVSGRLLIDGQLVADLHPDSLPRCAHWISSDGALVTGTVQDNLLGLQTQENPLVSAGVEFKDLPSVLAATNLTDAVRSLPDGSATLITPNDDRLAADSAFRIGLARALLRKPSVAVIEEPPDLYNQEIEQLTLEAMRRLVTPTTISIVLPQRLATLRQCDMVVMLHDHEVLDSGTHAELLQRNEFYRHQVYLRFNPFRRVS